MKLDLQPRVPSNLSPQAQELLERLRDEPSGGAFVLGGGVALSHYCEYRETYDLDAWWNPLPDEAAWEAAVRHLRAMAGESGQDFQQRRWGETRSAELRRGSRKVFSFQCSIRDIFLDRPGPSSWGNVQLESFRDNLGSKMNALVERGAPRDLRDVAEICRRELASVEDCWQLWRLKNPNRDREEARLKILYHLEMIEQRRPLAGISDAALREQAIHVRSFMIDQLCQPAGL